MALWDLVKAAPIVRQAVCLGLVSHQFLKEMFRVVAVSVSVLTSFLDEEFFAGGAVWIPKLEGDGVDRTIVAILSVTESSG